MTDLTLNEFGDIPEEELSKLLLEEAGIIYGKGREKPSAWRKKEPPDSTLKTRRKSFFNKYKVIRKKLAFKPF